MTSTARKFLRQGPTPRGRGLAALAVVLLLVHNSSQSASEKDDDYAKVAHLISRRCFERDLNQRNRSLLVDLATRSPRELPAAAGCWTSPPSAEALAAFQAALGIGSQEYQLQNRWTSSATNGSWPPGTALQGEPITLTYSFVPDGTLIESGGFGDPTGPSDLFATLDSLFGNPSTWQGYFHSAFQRWGELSGITFVFEPNDDGLGNVAISSAATINQNPSALNPGVPSVRGDIRIGGKNVDGSSGFNLLAFSYWPNHGDLVIDTSNVAFFGQLLAGDPLAFRNVIAHETGHGIGLDHVCPYDATKLMESVLSTAYDGPQHDDVLGVQRHYGDPLEPNDSSATATDLGLLSSGSHLTSNLSTDDDLDHDYYTFSVNGLLHLDIAVIPVGQVYPQGPQQPGSCIGTLANSATASDLSFELIASDGVTVLQIVSTTASGFAEQITCFSPPQGASDLYVHVIPGPSDTVQLYDLEITIHPPIHVPGDFLTIQEAIDNAACPGQAILVAPGTYGGFNTLGKAVHIKSEQGREVTFLDDGSYLGIRFNSGEGPDTIIDGFTMHGYDNFYGDIFCGNFVPSTAIPCSPTFRDCTFITTHIAGSSSPTIENCLFDASRVNLVNHTSTGTHFIDGCRFESSELSLEGDGVIRSSQFVATGVWLRKSSQTIESCSFVNHALGVSLEGGVFDVVNCLIAFNGTGISLSDQYSFGPTTATILNSTLRGNGPGGGITLDPLSAATIVNSIVWGNQPLSITGGTVTAAHSDIEGTNTWPGLNNINMDPVLYDAGSCKHHLLPTSPCWNTGDSTVPGLPITDLGDNPRIADGAIDMGAYEGLVDCYRGTQEDLDLLSGTSGFMTGSSVKLVSEGATLAVSLSSPSSTFSSVPFVLAAQLFTPTVPPVQIWPALHVGPPGLFLLEPASGTLPYPLPAGGFTAAYLLPLGLAGTSVMIQGICLGAPAANTSYASSDGHEIVITN